MASPEADLLKVSAQAGLDEIKKAYRKAALEHHPDHNPHPHAARHFRRLTEAYRLLSEEALGREPPKPRRPVAPADRIGFVLSDIRALLRRWPTDRWTKVVDGLPAVVWVAGALEVLARNWPGAPEAPPVVPTVPGIGDALEGWPDRMAGWPLPTPLPGPQARAMDEAIDATQRRLAALERPKRQGETRRSP
jgi:hypothetical protein